MTRINLVPVEELVDAHLIAEYRELPRIFTLAKEVDDIPDTYRLGTGHMKFFYNKLGFLFNRQFDIWVEMLDRGFNPSFPPSTLLSNFYEDKLKLWNYWTPSEEDIALSRSRVEERLKTMKNIKKTPWCLLREEAR